MPPTGPHVAIAVICERVLKEEGGVLSIIRVVDRLTQTASGPDPPQQMPAFIIGDVQMVLSLKPDRSRGRFSIKIVVEDPMGVRMPAGERDINLQGRNLGINLIMPLNVAVQHEGVYWFDVLLGGPKLQEDELLTRVPLEVLYQRQPSPGSRTEAQP